MMSAMVISKSNHDVQLAEKVRTINVVLVQQEQNGSDCKVFAIAYASNLTFINDLNATF